MKGGESIARATQRERPFKTTGYLAKVAVGFALALSAMAQGSPDPPPGLAPTMLPAIIVTAGGGYATPGGTFAYMSESSLVLPQGTYATVAQEYTMQHGQVKSCTFAGLTKPMYAFSVVTIGLTGLGGGCTSSSGDASVAASGQGFLHVRWGRLPFGNVVTVMKDSNSGYKVTLGWTWSKPVK